MGRPAVEDIAAVLGSQAVGAAEAVDSLAVQTASNSLAAEDSWVVPVVVGS